MEHRKNLTAMEMVWRGSNSLEDGTVFAGNFASGECSQGAAVILLCCCCAAALLAWLCLGSQSATTMWPLPAGHAMPIPSGQSATTMQATTVRQRGLGLSGPALPSWTTPAWTSTTCRTGKVAGERGRTALQPTKASAILPLCQPCLPARAACLPPTYAPNPPPPAHLPAPPPCPTSHRVDAFVEQCRQLANVTRGPDIMFTMGSDFQFQNAHLQYKNLDKLIHYVNQDGRVNAFYSTPAE